MAVNYNGYTVSDNEVKNVLQAISDYFEADVNVTSGNRSTVPQGGSTTSLHLVSRAADFHVDGYDDGTAYLHIKVFASAMFAMGNGYEFIRHGAYTQTGGAHLHLGRYGTAGTGYVKFKKEGLTSADKGVYTLDIEMPLIWAAR